MVTQHMVNERFDSITRSIATTQGVTECALLTRDGTLVGKKYRESVPSPSVAAMTATMFASAEAASSMLKISETSHVVAYTNNTLLLVINAGNTMLISATVDRSIDISSVFKHLQEVATKIEGEVVA